MKIYKNSHFYALVGVLSFSFVALLVFLMSFNPSEIGFFGTLVPLVLLWIFIFSTLRISFFVLGRRSTSVFRFLSVIIPSVIVLSLMFSALGEVSVLDVLLLFVLASLGNFYLVRTWPK